MIIRKKSTRVKLSDIDSIRHSLAHLLAMAVLKKFPEAKLGIGPVIENGFYYDFQLPKSINEDDLREFEQTMRGLIAQNLAFRGEKITPAKARALFKNQPFKLDLIKEFAKEKKPLTIYHTLPPTANSQQPIAISQKSAHFFDLCRGGHIKNTNEISPNAFALTRIAGAYWKGDEKNVQLTRIYGVAFVTKTELDGYLKMQTEAAARDHRKLGKELGLFLFSDLVGPGLPLYTPRGAGILSRIKEYSGAMRQEIGYQEVQTPNMNKGELFKISGHYDKFRENLFRVLSNYTDEEYFLKPMNCPQHTQIFASEIRSYKDLPIKYADFAMLHRDEKPGELAGLARLRSFSQDDGHCFCSPDQIEQEFAHVLNAVKKMMTRYTLSYYIRFSLRDEKNKSAYLGSDAIWKQSQDAVRRILKDEKMEFREAMGEAAFYGPKIDLIAKDSLGREWQLSTVQLDFNMPARFGLEYVDEQGKKRTPVMIHSALVGSPERFLAVLIEHCAGAFPLWLAPVQVAVLTINDSVRSYAENIRAELVTAGWRAETDDRNETVGKKIRDAELAKIPSILVIGPREQESKTVAARMRGVGDIGSLTLDSFMDTIKQE